MGFVIHDCFFLVSAIQRIKYPLLGPPEVAFAGRSNVGKSSMLRALLGCKKIVRVSSEPGCTKQINFFSINNDQIRLVDLPGYGYAQVPVKIKLALGNMIEEYLLKRVTLMVVVVVIDIRRDLSSQDLAFLKWLYFYNMPILIVTTKIDKLSHNKINARLIKLEPQLIFYDPDFVLFSAKTNEGRNLIWQRVCSFIDNAKKKGGGGCGK